MVTSTMIQEIKAGKIGEGQGCDFKQTVALDNAAGKANLVNDVVAFLNAGPGRLIIGVAEKRGAFDGFHLLSGDPDAMCLRIQQIVQDNIQPKPTRVATSAVTVEGGFLIDIEIPEHLRRPYQNTISGAFHIRAGARTTPLTWDMVQAMFVSQERQENDLAARVHLEDRSLDKQGIMEAGPALHLGVLPREHYLRTKAPFRRVDGMRVKLAPTFHDDRPSTFEGCNGGFHAMHRTFNDKVYFRMFVGNDWFLHARVAFPFRSDESGGSLHSLKPSLVNQRWVPALISATRC